MKFIYIISMGHDFFTPGKRANGFFEWEFNRDVGNRLYNLLSQHGIVHFVVDGVKNPFDETTKAGRLANLEYRCENANEIEKYYQGIYGKENVQAIFIAIHANAADDQRASGYSIHLYRQSGKRYEIAKCVYKAAEEILGVGDTIKSRGFKEGNLYVNENTNMPSILIEHEFFTNLEAVEKLKDNDFRQKCAEHINRGMLYYSGAEIEEPIKKDTAIINVLVKFISGFFKRK